MKYYLLIPVFLLFALAPSCRKKDRPVPVFNDSSSQAGKKFLALGDSYTIGQGVGEAERFPAQTVSMLRDSGVNISQLTYIATSGWTTLSLENAINTRQPQSNAPYDIVSLLIGVNDQYQIGDTFGYRDRFTRLLNTSISLAGNDRSRVFVLSIPDYSVTPFARGLDTARIRRQIDWFNDINRDVTINNNISYTYITAWTREAKTDKTLLCPDSLHPSGKEYARWATTLAPLMKRVIR